MMFCSTFRPRQVADAQARAAIHRQGGDVGVVEQDGTRVRLHQPHDHVEGGGLAGTVGTQQPHRLAAPDADRHVPHDRALLVGLAEPPADQPGGARRHVPGGPAAFDCHARGFAGRPARGLAGRGRAVGRVVVGHDQALDPVARVFGHGGEAGVHVDDGGATVQLVLTPRDVDVPHDSGNARIGDIHATIAGDRLGRCPHHDVAVGLGLLQLARRGEGIGAGFGRCRGRGR